MPCIPNQDSQPVGLNLKKQQNEKRKIPPNTEISYTHKKKKYSIILLSLSFWEID